MARTVIHMKYNEEDLKSIYFQAGEHRIFFGPRTKKQSIYLLIVLLGYPFVLYKAIQDADYFLLISVNLLFILLIFNFRKVARPIVQWRNSVNQFLDKSSKIKDLRLEYDQTGFTHVQDEEIWELTWKQVNKAELTDRYICLYAEENVMLPKSSMTPDQYTQLAKTVVKQVKNKDNQMRK